jgi:hypothetical protein
MRAFQLVNASQAGIPLNELRFHSLSTLPCKARFGFMQRPSDYGSLACQKAMAFFNSCCFPLAPCSPSASENEPLGGDNVGDSECRPYVITPSAQAAAALCPDQLFRSSERPILAADTQALRASLVWGYMSRSLSLFNHPLDTSNSTTEADAQSCAFGAMGSHHSLFLGVLKLPPFCSTGRFGTTTFRTASSSK